MIKEFYASGSIKAILSEDLKSARVFKKSGEELEAIVKHVSDAAQRISGRLEIQVLGPPINGNKNARELFMQVFFIKVIAND